MATSQKVIAEHEIWERARLARDPRFDGRFFIGVRTTGIYCRPICPANAPRSENVTYYPSAAAAAEAGYRPCLRCRPETAPGTPAWAGTSTTVQRGLRLIASGALENSSIEALSDRLGVTSRHLRRLFQDHLGASPQAVAHTQRLHFAKRLIDETRLPLAQVAQAAGYGSVRRFNDAFRNSYKKTPRELRKFGDEDIDHDRDAPLSVTLAYRKPFNWQAVLDYLALRGIPGVEAVTGDTYTRTIRAEKSSALLQVCPEPRGERLRLTLQGMETGMLFTTVQRVRDMLDLDAPVDDIAAVLAADDVLAPRLEALPGVRVAGAWDGFELAVRTILGQQVSVAGATTMCGRVAAAFGEQSPLGNRAESDIPSILFPAPAMLADAPLEKIGVVRSRAAAIRSLARAVTAGEVRFESTQDPEQFVRALTSIKGIGAWTAAYLRMRVLKDPDAFPATDLGLCKALDPSRRLSPKALASRAEAWRPWRAYAAMLLWQTPAEGGGKTSGG